jgi:hypothetical protein
MLLSKPIIDSCLCVFVKNHYFLRFRDLFGNKIPAPYHLYLFVFICVQYDLGHYLFATPLFPLFHGIYA